MGAAIAPSNPAKPQSHKAGLPGFKPDQAGFVTLSHEAGLPGFKPDQAGFVALSRKAGLAGFEPGPAGFVALCREAGKPAAWLGWHCCKTCFR